MAAARRNALLAHAVAALRASQHKLDELDAFVAAHFEGPWVAAGIGAGKQKGRRHFVDTVVGWAAGVRGSRDGRWSCASPCCIRVLS
jgi:hypothetical protein